jgi:tight adherence protein C
MLQNSLDFFTATLGPSGPVLALGVLGMFVIIMTLPFLLTKKADPFDRLAGSAVAPKPKVDKGKAVSLRPDQSGPNLDRFANYLEPQDTKQFSERRLKLVQAGYRSRSAVRTYHFMQFVLGMTGLLAGTLYVLFSSDAIVLTTTGLKILGPGLIGYYLPSYWVERRKQARAEQITNGFPDALDLMLVCIEAGQSLDQCIQRVAREIQTSFPELAEEFTIVSNEMRAGKERVNVLRDLAERCGVPDINSFVTVLIQSASFGTSIGDALRVYASEMRDKRVTRAEEKANTLPTKMTLCTMLFTVPPLLVILVGPSVFDIYINMVANNG